MATTTTTASAAATTAAATTATTAAAAAAQTGGRGQRLVLISVDNSQQAEQAFEYYANNIHRTENKILCVHVSEPPYLPSTSSAEVLEKIIQDERDKAKALEKKYEAKLKEHHLPGRIRTVFHNRAGEAIVTEALKERVDMVVMGTRGLGAIRRTVLGSVSDYVLHHLHCPVVVCRQ